MKRKYSFGLVIFFVGWCSLLTSCKIKPKPLKLGVDQCDYCMMTISDAKFGGELITKKGKIYIFDDPHCVISFIKEKKVSQPEIREVLLTDYSGQHELVNVNLTHLYKSDELRSPMGGNIAAFRDIDSLNFLMKAYTGVRVVWDDLVR